MEQPLWKTVCQFLTKLNILLDMLLDTPEGVENLGPHKSLHPKFTAALFITAQTWKQLRCSSEGEWINKLWYIQTIEYYSAIKRNALISHAKTWRRVKCILLSERSPSEKATYCMIPTT